MRAQSASVSLARVLEADGPWYRDDGSNARVLASDELPVSTSIRFRSAPGQVDGKLILTSLDGAFLYSRQCNSTSRCDTLVVVPRPAVAGEGILARVYSILMDRIRNDGSKYSRALSAMPKLGGDL